MVKTHMHKGVARSNGVLRSHPIARQHKNKNVEKYHNISLKGKENKQPVKQEKQSFVKKLLSKQKPKNEQSIPIDDDGYINIDLDESEGIRGVRLKFTRIEGRLKRRVALQFDK